MIKKLLNWLDDNVVALWAGFLIVFIPLYPKWPLFDVLYGYNVRVRLEDFFVLGILLVAGIQLVRKKFQIVWSPISIGLLVYLLVGFLSVLSSIFLINTVPQEYLHMAKTFLHWLRRVEYLSLFFIVFGSIKSWKTAKVYLWLFFITFFGVIIYGFGQKYLYWPAFSTMNREFAKGWWLYLTEHARVLSTFGGHYDLAGYLVIALSLSWSFFFGSANRLAKLGLGLLLSGGFWLLILTASRISFAGYIAGLSTVVLMWSFRNGFKWGLSRWVITVGLSLLLMFSFGDLSDRFLRLMKLDQRFGGLKTMLLSPSVKAPTDNAAFLENNLAAVTSRSDKPPSTTRPGDVSGNEIPLFIVEKTASGASVLVEKTRTYSKNALLYDLSTGIRLDSTWPNAIKGFQKNIFFGSGYATLSKANPYEFTEGESTDSDYLRALGETGLLGFLAFFGTLGLMILIVFRSLSGIQSTSFYALAAGFIGLLIGLLVNATTIDIFVASKVAYVFWGIAGLLFGLLNINRDNIKQSRKPFRIYLNWSEYRASLVKFLKSEKLLLLLIFLLAFLPRLYKLDAPIADWHSWRQADTSAVTRNFIKLHAINWLYPTYDDISSIASGKPNLKGLRMVEFPIYNGLAATVKNLVPEITVEQAGRLTSALISSLGGVFLYLIISKMFSKRLGLFTAIAFAVIPYNIFYGRTVLPDPSMVTAALAGVWFMLKYSIENRKKHLFLAIVLAASALLIKPYAIFILAPTAFFIFPNVSKSKMFAFGLFFILTILPLLLWRLWISNFPEGVPANSWLLNGDGIRFKGAWWYWIFGDRIGRLILGGWGLIFLALGLLKEQGGKYRYFPVIFFICSLSFLAVFATGNVRHDYYQILIIPAISIVVGIGVEYLFTQNKLLALIFGTFMLGFGWYHVRDFYNINHPEIVNAGHRVEELSNWKALVVAPYGGDTAFLYQTSRKGWPIMEGSIDEMINKGAHYYVSVKFDEETNKIVNNSWPKGLEMPLGINRRFYLLEKTDEYVIIQLVPDRALPGN